MILNIHNLSMTVFHNGLENTLSEISRYTSYLCQAGDKEMYMRCYMMLQGVNNHIQTMYYHNVVRPQLTAVWKKEHVVTAYVATATCVFIWATAMKDHANPFQAVVIN